jgi:hypothetical protein
MLCGLFGAQLCSTSPWQGSSRVFGEVLTLCGPPTYRYEYPTYHTTVIAKHPLSRFRSPVRGPGLSPKRSAHGLNVVSRAVLAEEQKF